MAWVPAVIAGVTSILGSDRANRQRRQQAAQSHQTEVEDLRAAGLNPILSGTGGPGAPQAQIEDVVSPAVNSALAQRTVSQELRNLKKAELLLSAQKSKVDAETQGQLSTNAMLYNRVSSAAELNRIEVDNARQTNLAMHADNVGRQNQAEFEAKKLGDIFKGNWRDMELGDVRRMLDAVLGLGNSARSIAR